jgi:peptidylprolyl isomerase
MKRVSLVAAATLTLLVSGFTLALAADAPATDAKKAAPAADAKKAAPAAVSGDKALAAIDAQIAAAKVVKTNASWKSHLPMPKAVTFDPAKKYFVRMVTSEGPILIRFMPDIAPMHVTNFIYLTRMGFYDGIVFHRVITNFMAQGGDPLGNGMGGPGYGFAGEFSDKAKHDHPGMLSMANAGPGTDGSQFFLTFVATPWLNGKHTVFGEVVEGLDVLKKLEANGSQSGATTKKMTIDKCTAEVQ